MLLVTPLIPHHYSGREVAQIEGRLYGLDPTIEAFLDNPVSTFKAEGIKDKGLRVTVLSNIAEGCVNLVLSAPEGKEQAEECLDTVIKTALSSSVSPYGGSPAHASSLGNHGIYLSHLNVILGAHKRLTGSDKHERLNKRISTYLARRSLQDPHKHMRSYSTLKGKWPADHAVTLYSLYLFDQNYGESLSEKPIQEWLSYMKTKGTDSDTDLHVSEVTGGWSYSKHPRGCALSMTVRYMAAFAPEEAEALWKDYKKHFGTPVGFREYPPGVKIKADVDSGPIVPVLGVGVAATALAVGASNAVDDHLSYFQLQALATGTETTLNLLPSIGPIGEIQTISQSLLAETLQLSTSTVKAWY